MGRSVVFNGVELTIPGAYSLLDVSRLLTPTSGGVGIVALIGEADGGKPGLHLFQGGASKSSVKTRLKSGPGANMVPLALRAGSDPRVPSGASAVLFYKTNNSLAASLSLGQVTGVAEVRQFSTVADVAGSLNNTYLDNLVAANGTIYYVWYNVASGGTDPALVGKTGIMVAIGTGDTANAVATATRAALNAVSGTPFSAGGSAALVTVTNTGTGDVADLADGAVPTGFTGISTTTQGVTAETPAIVLTTKQYGLFTNQYTAEISTALGASILTIRDENGIPESSVPVGSFEYASLQYSGNGTTATASLKYVSSMLKLQSTLSGQSDGSVNLDIDASLMTLKQLQSAIATASSGYSLSITAGKEQMLVKDLDLVKVAQNIKSPAKLSFKAGLFELVQWSNTQSQLVTVARGSGNDADVVPPSVSVTAFSGGARGASSNSSVQAAFDALLEFRVNIAVPLFSSDNQDGSTVLVASANSILKDHVENRSSLLGRSECQGYVSIAGNKDAFKAECARLNSRWLSVTSQKVTELDIDGNLIEMPEYAFAVVCAQTQAGSAIGTPLTNRIIPSSGLSQDVSWKPSTDGVELIKAGGLIAGADENNVLRVIAGYTCWLGDTNNANIYIETVESLAIFAFNHRQFMRAKFVGVSDFNEQDVLDAIDRSCRAEKNDTKSIKGYDPKQTVLSSITGGQLRYEVAPIPWEGIVFVLPTIVAIREAT